MEINDEYIIEYLKSKKQIRYKTLHDNVKEYLLNRYHDSLSIEESVYRILNNIEIRPICKICGNPVVFKKFKGFSNYCSKSCLSKDAAKTRFNNPNYHSPFCDKHTREKANKTIYDRYGVNSVLRLPEIIEKGKQTKLERYGSEKYHNTQKFKETCLQRYGVEYPAQNKEIKEKQKTTSIQRYGGVFNKKKVSETIKEKYGVDWYTQTPQLKSKTNTEESKEKEYNTKKLHNSFNKSKSEENTYVNLLSKYPDVVRQYKSEKYPYVCDFYVPSLDLYIECNYHWTHGNHRYDCDSDSDNKILELWRLKNSKFYDNAIETWTIRDINKFNTAANNNLNYLVFYSYDEFVDWFEKQ